MSDTVAGGGGGFARYDSSGRLRCINPSCSRPWVKADGQCKRCNSKIHIVNSENDNEDRTVDASGTIHANEPSPISSNELSGYKKTIAVARERSDHLLELKRQLDKAKHEYKNANLDAPNLADFNHDVQKWIPHQLEHKRKLSPFLSAWEDATEEYNWEKESANFAVLKSMRVDDPVSLDLLGDDDVVQDYQGRADEISKVVSKTVLKDSKIETTLKYGRPGYNVTSENYPNANGKIDVPPQSGIIAWAHEFGHHIECQGKDHDPLYEAISFWKKRTSGESFQRVKDATGEDYADDEMFRDGNFVTPYTGKVYMDETTGIVFGTEIISVGMEQLFEDAVSFYQNDPEHFEFMTQLLRGDLTNGNN